MPATKRDAVTIVVMHSEPFKTLPEWQSIDYTMVTVLGVTLHNSTVGNIRRYLADCKRQNRKATLKQVKV